ncbi:MAG: hypothetical protein IJ023_07445 [Bacteroidales bacterium]|nr:hypothetical protein [Bacteroidales bacterium]
MVGLFSSIIMPAQNLPVMAPDKAVKTGTLPNGTSYYIVSNQAIKGMADFALVQKTGTDNLDDTSSFKAVSIAREALSVLPRSGGRSVQDFFMSHGVNPGRDGFVKVAGDATEYRFSNVLISKPEVLDSALLVLLDMVDRVSDAEDPFLKKWYAPSDQVIIVVGDVDASSVADKMKMISYMTPSSASSPRKGYVWEGRDTAVYAAVPAVHDSLASFTMVWNSARTPREYMNTVQPVIYEMFLAELGMLSEEYIKDGLRGHDIPYAEVRSGFRTSIQSSDDEVFSISVSVAPKDFQEALKTVAAAVGRIDAGRTDVRDLMRMKRICMDQGKEQILQPYMSNSEHVDRCVSAFLYNGSLASLKTKVDFLAGRALADTTELRLFNNISSALLDPEKNLTVSYTSPVSEDSVRALLNDGWKAGAGFADNKKRFTADDILPYVYEGEKIKVVEKADPMSKGLEWTFSNGFKVVYRRMPSGKKMYYNLAYNAGYSSVENLAKDEGGYVSDYFLMSRICGMPGEDFRSVLASEGMTMEMYVGLNATMISGCADDNDLDFMMNALLSAVYDRRPDKDAVRYYESCEPLRHARRMDSASQMVSKVNEIMCPDYQYGSHKALEHISPDLSERAEKFFSNLAKHPDDGVLILVGDVEPSALKKKLLAYVGHFESDGMTLRKPLVRYQPASGWSTYTVEGDRNSVDIALSVPLTLTADNYMAAEIVSMVLKKHLADAIAETGMYLDLSHECRIYPNERVNFHISLNEISENGFSSETTRSGSIEALEIVRSVLSGSRGVEVSKEEVEAFKGQIKAGIEMEMKEPFYWLNVISRRRLAGKDFTTSYDARIKSVTADKVKSIIAKLNEGTRVEYIVSER